MMGAKTMGMIDGQEKALIEWNDINDIIDELLSVLDDIETNHRELDAFKAPIARAIANMRADRTYSDASLAKALAPRVMRSQHVAFVTAELLWNDLAAMF
jgi:hypothetical protein